VSPEGNETVLYSFCAQANCADGAQPYAGVVFDQKGNLYGTAYSGGNNKNRVCHPAGCGVVFKLTLEGKETVLYRFCAKKNCTDGANPESGLVFDEEGNLYGTAVAGGLTNQTYCLGTCGVVFKLTPEGKETVLHRFCAQSKCVDGLEPAAGVVFDQKGNLYGTTAYGGAYNNRLCDPYIAGCGVVFKLTPKGKETVLYSFCTQSNCTDGASPYAELVLDQKGNLYGTTGYGGANCTPGYGCGVVFKLTPKGKETVLYSFCAQTDCTDGNGPHAGVVFDQNGNLYGTTADGGITTCNDYVGCGVVFKLTPKGKETVLYSFCPQNNCTDGAYPSAGLVLDQKGDLYGTTYDGGGYGGVVFKLTP